MREWLQTVLDEPFQLEPLTPGAGLRRYFRVVLPKTTYVVMSAEAGDEKSETFVQLSHAFQAVGVCTPTIYASDLSQGFLLLTDFGTSLYESLLNDETADFLYQNAFSSLLRLQSYPKNAPSPLRSFDMDHYRLKMTWFYEYYCQRYLNIALTKQHIEDLHRMFDTLITTATQQPVVCVHYDYHCRNLMQLPNHQVGVLDFQDAVWGPITYDLMSLLCDCYVQWPESRVQYWSDQYLQKALHAGLLSDENPKQWRQWCDFSSLQRQIKCVGLFARFHVTGHSSSYLTYIPRMLRNLQRIADRYEASSPLSDLLRKLPA